MFASWGCANRDGGSANGMRKLSHEQTLEWIGQNRSWQRAKKTKPMWVRPVEKEEIGKEFQTADHAIERAAEGYWLCVGLAGEPWLQLPKRIEARYDRGSAERKQFAFDTQPRNYHVYKPKGDIRNWVAQVKGPGIEGFFIKPNYDVDHPLYSPAGGYVVKDDVPDPYKDQANDVWLVQEAIFNNTYELIKN